MDVPVEVFLPHECRYSPSCPPHLECGKPLSQASPREQIHTFSDLATQADDIRSSLVTCSLLDILNLRL